MRSVFNQLPYRWRTELILKVWEYHYQRRRRSWHWCSNQLSGSFPRRAGQRDGLVSVILPVYNQAATLEAAIKSVLQQTYPQLELIVVNDGSTDETPAVLDRFVTSPKIKVLHQANCRLPTALNRGFQAGRGEFFTWTSADNLMHPDQINQLVAYLRDHPDVALVYADFELIDEASRPISGAANIIMRGEADSAIVRPKREPVRLNVGYESVIGPCFLYRSFLPLLIGEYNPELEGSEDFDYWIRIHNFFKVNHLGSHQPLYKYRIHSNRMSTRLKKQIRRWRQWLMQREQQFQRRLNRPIDVAADEPSRNLMAHFKAGNHPLPWLDLKPLTEHQQEQRQPAALLLKATAANLAMIKKLRRRRCLPLILWAAAADASLLAKAGPLTDLIIVLTDSDELHLRNVLIAQSIHDVGELIRIFVGSRINAGVIPLPR